MNWSKLLLLVATGLFGLGVVLALLSTPLGPITYTVAGLAGLMCFAGAGLVT